MFVGVLVGVCVKVGVGVGLGIIGSKSVSIIPVPPASPGPDNVKVVNGAAAVTKKYPAPAPSVHELGVCNTFPIIFIHPDVQLDSVTGPPLDVNVIE